MTAVLLLACSPLHPPERGPRDAAAFSPPASEKLAPTSKPSPSPSESAMDRPRSADTTTAPTQRAWEAIAQLGSEHAHERDKGRNWLLAHPDTARGPLRTLLQSDEAHESTRNALDVLARIGNPDDVPVLVERLRRGGELNAMDAALALAHHPASAALEALVAALSDPRPELADAAALALGERKDPAARPHLERALHNPSPSVRYKAVRALASLGVEASRQALTELKRRESDPDVRGALDKALTP